MSTFEKNIQLTGDYFIHQFTDTDVASLCKDAESKLLSEGYKLSEGGGANAVYEKGNRTMRILFGAFVKYYKFAVQVKEAEGGAVQLRVTKHSSGMSGGLIGVGQVKNELKRLALAMQNLK